MIDLFFCLLFCLMFILLCYYGIFNQSIFIDDKDVATNYTEKEIEDLLVKLIDYSIPDYTDPADTSYPLPYFQNAIDSLSKDDDELDKKLRVEISLHVEPIPTKTISYEDSKYVGGEDVFSDLKTWNSDVTTLANYGARVLNMAKALANQTQTTSFLNKDFLDAIVYACQQLDDKITAWEYKPNTFPWGANWYQFSVSIPYYYVCIYYILRNIYNWAPTEIAKIKANAISWINKLTQDPQHGIGWTRTGPNTILMGMPWTVVKYWEGKLDEVKTLPEVIYMSDQSNVKTVVTGEGMRPDGGYIFHTNVRAYGYVASSLKSANILNCLIPNNFGTMYQYLSNKMCHPNIDANLAGLFSREPVVKRFMNAGQLGAFAQFSGGLLTYKQPKWFIQIMGCITGVAYYEADKANDHWAPAWIMLREMWTSGSLIRQYNKNTLIYFPGYTRLQSDTTGESPSFPTKTTTTTSMVPTNGDSAVIIDEKIAFMYTTWKIDGTGDAYYTLLGGYQYKELTWLTETGRSTIIYFTKSDIDKHGNVIHTMELGVPLNIQKNGVIRFTNGKNVYPFVGNFTTGKEVDIDFRDGHTEKQIPYFLEPVLNDDKTLYVLAYSVWFDNTTEDVVAPHENVLIKTNSRGDALFIDGSKFVCSTIVDGAVLELLTYIKPEKVETGEIALLAAPSSRASPVSAFAVPLARLSETMPLGLMPEYLPTDKRYFIRYINADSGIPSASDNTYCLIISAHDFKFQAEFSLYKWLKEVDYSQQNVAVTKGQNGGGFYFPKLEIIETDRCKRYNGGLPWSFMDPKCNETITNSNLSELRKKYEHESRDDDYTTWDEWKL